MKTQLTTHKARPETVERLRRIAAATGMKQYSVLHQIVANKAKELKIRIPKQ